MSENWKERALVAEEALLCHTGHANDMGTAMMEQLKPGTHVQILNVDRERVKMILRETKQQMKEAGVL